MKTKYLTTLLGAVLLSALPIYADCNHDLPVDKGVPDGSSCLASTELVDLFTMNDEAKTNDGADEDVKATASAEDQDIKTEETTDGVEAAAAAAESEAATVTSSDDPDATESDPEATPKEAKTKSVKVDDDYKPWFERCEKIAQFNSRNQPEDGEAFRTAYNDGKTPEVAVDELTPRPVAREMKVDRGDGKETV